MSVGTEARWEHFPHGADIGIRGVGPTLESALEQAALALTAVVVDPNRVDARERVEISCRATSPDETLIDWLDAIVYEMATRRMVFGRFEVLLEDSRLSAHAWGETVDPVRHEPAVEVKGPTYTLLRVFRDEGLGAWTAQCVVDV
jgi:tRNA nucleotidyltransferase (CCA-adding enzyme)